tara:strand:+ start:718 stop:4206 length:3489 start_codon:yes stop_codon:yes gene_type:complete
MLNKSMATSEEIPRTFNRSANITRDTAEGSAKPNYSFSNSSIDLIDLVLDAATHKNADKAISVVGPYGSGKSMFGVLLSELARNPDSSWVQSALVGLNSIAPKTGQKVSTAISNRELEYKVIPIIGSRGSISISLVNALSDLCEAEDTGWISPDFAGRVSRLVDQVMAGIIDTSEIARFYSETAKLATTAGNKGLIILIDEFGQFLEHAASVEAIDNLLLAQQLAEESSRAKDGSLLLLTFLHQSVAHYSRSGNYEQFTEWQKIQGRFREVAFNEDPENQYELIHGAISSLETSFTIKKWAERIEKQAKQVHLFSTGPTGKFWSESISRFAPLHPSTVFALPRLSAIVGQNQRTLFGFTDSNDPNGLRGIINSSNFEPSINSSITVDQLFDFFLRPASPVSIPDDARRRIAEANAALDRLGDRPSLESKIIKALAVLSVVQPGTRLITDESMLAFSLDLNKSSQNFKNALEQLISRKLIVFRKFSSEYKLWQGTDFDVDFAVRHITEDLLHEESINTLLAPDLKPRLITARRHSFTNGTARTFGWRIASANEVSKKGYVIPSEIGSDNDGVAILVLTENHNQIAKAQNWAKKQTDKNLMVLISTHPSDLAIHIKTLAAAQKVESVYPVLGDDHVAKAEITARIDYQSNLVTELFDHMFYDHASLNVFWAGERRRDWDNLPFSEVASSICDQVYENAPIIRNELVNRKDVSPTGIAAVKKAVDTILKGTNELRGGLDGQGAEVSIFRSLFEDTGLFRKSGSPEFRMMQSPPGGTNDNSRLKPLWAHISKWSKDPNNSPSGNPAPFVRLLNELMAPPFGVKRGLALILIWSFIMGRRKEIALYDNGTYTTDWNVEDFDRYLKHPEFYSVQWFSSRSKIARAFAQLSNSIPDHKGLDKNYTNVSLAGFLGKLYSWYRRLPPYTTSTNTISEKSIALRRAIVSAIDPVELVFSRIPEAVGIPALENRKHYPPEVIREFSKTVDELDGTYIVLLNWITDQIYEVLGWGRSTEKMMIEFANMKDQVMNRISDPTMKSFIIRGKAKHDGQVKWLEAISSALSGQSPRFWNDHTKQDFLDRLKMFKIALGDANRRAYAAETASNERGLRILVESGDIVHEEVISTEPIGQSPLVNIAIDRLFDDHDLESSEQQLKFLYQQIARKLKNTGK